MKFSKVKSYRPEGSESSAEGAGAFSGSGCGTTNCTSMSNPSTDLKASFKRAVYRSETI